MNNSCYIFIVLFLLAINGNTQNKYIFAGDTLLKGINFQDIADVTIKVEPETDEWGKPYSTEYESQFDLNDDGIKDITFRGEYYFHIVYSSKRLLVLPNSGCSIAGVDGPKIFENNEQIDDTYSWSDKGSTLIMSSNYGADSRKWENMTDKYMAVKIVTHSDTLLGWLNLSISDIDNCKAVIKSYAIQKSKLELNSDNNNFWVYPNPSTSIIYIEIRDWDKESFLTILGSNGEQLSGFRLKNKTTSLDINGLKSGVYFLRLKNSKGITNRKLMKL